MATSLLGLVRLGFDAVFRPSSLVGARGGREVGSLYRRAKSGFVLTWFYLVSLFLYAAPLTYAGFGADDAPETVPPAIVELATILGTDPATTWLYTISLAENCIYLFVASVLTFGAFHVAVVLTRSSRGVLQSMRTIAYSTGIYLAVIFSLAWYLSIADRIVVADEWLIALQVEFVYLIMDAAGVSYEIPAPRLADVDTARMETTGRLVIAGLFVSGIYYLYSLYLGARINHRSGRFSSLITIAFVASTPVFYALGFVFALALIEGELIIA